MSKFSGTKKILKDLVLGEETKKGDFEEGNSSEEEEVWMEEKLDNGDSQTEFAQADSLEEEELFVLIGMMNGNSYHAEGKPLFLFYFFIKQVRILSHYRSPIG